MSHTDPNEVTVNLVAVVDDDSRAVILELDGIPQGVVHDDAS